MPNTHVLEASGVRYRLALHVSIPAGNNSAGIAWNTALVNSGLGGKTVLATGNGPGQITATELASVQAGNTYEQIDWVDVTQGGQLTTTAQQAAFLDDYYAARSVEVRTQLQAQLKWYGATR
jgi:hypothetical protein